ncbi:hypothetical protein LLEC1_01414 [Akanthomyces lecanii]|uniref:Transmembrane protein n=1 Tax=Cordyceps confragosa TaxID=2714763 RepID=A0A179IU66_CORDF|nr:hypothetical protein LLEC1_01414 [Akanthomyces lecanii]
MTGMPTARLGRAVDADANHAAANSVIDRLGGGGPGGQLIVRGFFMGIAFGLLVALLFCCWYPWLHMRHRDRQRAMRRILRRMDRPRRRRRRPEAATEWDTVAVVQSETAQAQTQTDAEEGTSTIMTTATGRASTAAAGAGASR